MTEVQTMPKPRKANMTKVAAQPARKTARKSAKSAKTQQPTTNATAVRAPKLHSSAMPARPSKKAAMLNLLQRPGGAAIGDLTAATGWQVYSVRAALTGLRNEGKELVRAKNAAGITHYRLAANA
jgi:hypothetical protein